jgi:predicted DsbA family dithiol-disulfide isomerase
VRVVFKSFLIHQEAVTPGLAGCAANKQGKWPEMRKLIWEEGFAKHDLSEKNMDALATKAGLDMAKYKADMQGDSCKAWIMAGHDELGKIGTNGTPAFYINGRYLSGALPIEQF